MKGNAWIFLGALLASIAVAAGAIGTHVLREQIQIGEPQLATYEVAVRYQMYHALGLIMAGMLAQRGNCRWLSLAGWAFLTGMVLFSGGLYAWLFSGIKPFVHVVPVGGLAWIVGWIFLAVSALRWPD